MKRLFSLLSFILIISATYAQNFSDTSQLNAFLRDTIKDRRPEKVTAAQIQKGFLGISKFLKPNALTSLPGGIFTKAGNGISTSGDSLFLGGDLSGGSFLFETGFGPFETKFRFSPTDVYFGIGNGYVKTNPDGPVLKGNTEMSGLPVPSIELGSTGFSLGMTDDDEINYNVLKFIHGTGFQFTDEGLPTQQGDSFEVTVDNDGVLHKNKKPVAPILITMEDDFEITEADGGTTQYELLTFDEPNANYSGIYLVFVNLTIDLWADNNVQIWIEDQNGVQATTTLLLPSNVSEQWISVSLTAICTKGTSGSIKVKATSHGSGIAPMVLVNPVSKPKASTMKLVMHSRL